VVGSRRKKKEKKKNLFCIYFVYTEKKEKKKKKTPLSLCLLPQNKKKSLLCVSFPPIPHPPPFLKTKFPPTKYSALWARERAGKKTKKEKKTNK